MFIHCSTYLALNVVGQRLRALVLDLGSKAIRHSTCYWARLLAAGAVTVAPGTVGAIVIGRAEPVATDQDAGTVTRAYVVLVFLGFVLPRLEVDDLDGVCLPLVRMRQFVHASGTAHKLEAALLAVLVELARFALGVAAVNVVAFAVVSKHQKLAISSNGTRSASHTWCLHRRSKEVHPRTQQPHA